MTYDITCFNNDMTAYGMTPNDIWHENEHELIHRKGMHMQQSMVTKLALILPCSIRKCVLFNADVTSKVFCLIT